MANSYFNCILIFTILYNSEAARILCISPMPFLSHQLPFQAVVKALASRGHQVTFISPNPQEIPIENLTEVDVSISYKYWRTALDFTAMHDINPLDTMSSFIDALSDVTEIQLSSPQVQEFIRRNNTKFDVVIMEKLQFQAYYGLIHHFGSPPVIGLLTFAGLPSSYSAYGNPHYPAFSPEILSSYTDSMSFWERFYNAYMVSKLLYLWYYKLYSNQEIIMRKYFGSSPTSIYDAVYSDSLLLTGHHWVINYPRPMLPNVVELTGIHIRNKIQPLPKEIQSFLDGAKHGVIYFSLGSNIIGSTMPKDKIKHLIEAFSEVPQRILWKWEGDTFPGKSDNVMIGKWFPQQDILAHPNVRIFITQCGAQSVQEAVYYAVPLIAMPFLGDQWYNMAKIKTKNIGIQLEFKEMTKTTLLEAIRKILNDSRYRDNMRAFSKIYREHQASSLDHAISWIEYVVRHNGARHMRSAALDLTWYQYLLLDVISVILICSLFLMYIIYILIKKIASFFSFYFNTVKFKTT